MKVYLDISNFPAESSSENLLAQDLEAILEDFTASPYKVLTQYKRILSDNAQRRRWPAVHKKLETMFKCGRCAPLNGPMVGVSMGIRDSDYFRDCARHFGLERSSAARIEWMSTAWNISFAYSGLWMGKTFEPVKRETVALKCAGNKQQMQKYSPDTTRLGRNFFRSPPDPSLLQLISLPSLSLLWNLKDRPLETTRTDFGSQLLMENLDKEKTIPFEKTGGYFLADFGNSVLPEMNEKPTYQLNYRWPQLEPVYPMTRLVDELVEIAEGIYLGQLIYATRHYSLGTITSGLGIKLPTRSIGEPYNPEDEAASTSYYAYQNNGYFLMLDPDQSDQIYSLEGFYELRPRPGERGFQTHYATGQPPAEKMSTGKKTHPIKAQKPLPKWQEDIRLKNKFTTFLHEPSPQPDDQDICKELAENESILEMLQRISQDISKQSHSEDSLKHFEKLNLLFRRGKAPTIKNGQLTGNGEKEFSHRLSGTASSWYGQPEPTSGVDFYHGATLNLHCGFQDSFHSVPDKQIDETLLFPSSLADSLQDGLNNIPNLLNITWHSIARYIFPWAGKSFQKISGRKLSMLVDESSDLATRYPQRVTELANSPASYTHYDLILKNQNNYFQTPGIFQSHLQSGCWDSGMSSTDKSFWKLEAENHWVYGTNLMDERILALDTVMKRIDINYKELDPVIRTVPRVGPSPFCGQGYIFLGRDGQESILPMNSGAKRKKQVFQFHYRYPMIGGPVPIGFCLDEIVEIASGLFLGQLIYSTSLDMPFHSSVDPGRYNYQLFGYFLLLDDEWQNHRLSIGLDVWKN